MAGTIPQMPLPCYSTWIREAACRCPCSPTGAIRRGQKQFGGDCLEKGRHRGGLRWSPIWGTGSGFGCDCLLFLNTGVLLPASPLQILGGRAPAGQTSCLRAPTVTARPARRGAQGLYALSTQYQSWRLALGRLFGDLRVIRMFPDTSAPHPGRGAALGRSAADRSSFPSGGRGRIVQEVELPRARAGWIPRPVHVRISCVPAWGPRVDACFFSVLGGRKYLPTSWSLLKRRAPARPSDGGGLHRRGLEDHLVRVC